MARTLFTHGAPFSSDEEAQGYFGEQLKLHNLAATDLDPAAAEFDDCFASEFCEDPVLIRAKEMAARALSALREAELEEQRLREEEEKAERIRQEQNAVSQRWQPPDGADLCGGQDGGKRSNKKKGKSGAQKKRDKRDKALAALPPTSGHAWAMRRHREQKARFSAILEGFAGKVAKMRHYEKGMRALQRVGLLDKLDTELKHGSHRVLHAKVLPSLTVAIPHGGKNSAERSLKIGV